MFDKDILSLIVGIESVVISASTSELPEKPLDDQMWTGTPTYTTVTLNCACEHTFDSIVYSWYVRLLSRP